MKTIDLKGSVRAETRKSALKKVRANDLVPAVVYGVSDPKKIALPYNALAKAIFTPDIFIVNLDIDGTSVSSLIREMQFHPVTEKILHVDFLEIEAGKVVDFELPVKLIGIAKGVREGGKLVPMMRRLRVEGVPAEMPDFVPVDVSGLELGKTIRVSEVDVTGIKITSPASAGIAIVDIPRAVRTGEEDGEGREEGGEEAAAEE
ncbi:MAG TPA: 50S ribosomal protein L25 [Bacteroidetes bacterium]|nr:50S ribosomal protein L25 [Bacteroidota bacterium]